MWTITILIYGATATKDAVTCDVRFIANGGPYDGAMLEKQIIYMHPTSVELIVSDLTNTAEMLKVSFDTPANLDGMTWVV